MKHLLVVMAILMCACGEAAENRGQDPKLATATAQSESVQPESTVIFQGLIAYVENKSGPPVEALLVNALPDPNVNIENATGALDLLSGKPAILNARSVGTNGMHLPAHEPFVAVENGTVQGETCFLGAAETKLTLKWEEEEEPRKQQLVLNARRLCAAGVCGKMTLKVGTENLAPDKIDLESLADAGDFSCQEGFLKLDSDIDDKLAARVEILLGTKAASKVLKCTSHYSTLTLAGDVEQDCIPNFGEKFAEQVEVSGAGEVLLQRGSEVCRFVPDSGKKMQVWIFNIHPASYDPSVTATHHPAFYWYYNLASTPCNVKDGEKSYPRLCTEKATGPGCGGDPKCPEVKLTR